MEDKKLIYKQYDHGGARFYFEDSEDNRDLIADTHQDEYFAIYINKCIADYFELTPKQRHSHD